MITNFIKWLLVVNTTFFPPSSGEKVYKYSPSSLTEHCVNIPTASIFILFPGQLQLAEYTWSFLPSKNNLASSFSAWFITYSSPATNISVDVLFDVLFDFTSSIPAFATLFSDKAVGSDVVFSGIALFITCIELL